MAARASTTSAFVPVPAVVNPTNAVTATEKSNHHYPQSVRVMPSRAPRRLIAGMPEALTTKLTLDGASFSAAKLAVQGIGSLAAPIPWVPDTNATGQLEIRLPRSGDARFYRVKGR